MVLEFTKTLCPKAGSRCPKDQSPGVASSTSPPAAPEGRLFCPGSLAQVSFDRHPRQSGRRETFAREQLALLSERSCKKVTKRLLRAAPW